MLSKHLFLFFPLALVSITALGADDTGKIVEVYSHPNGSIALRLDGGIPNARAANTCGFGANPLYQFAGVSPSDSSVIKSAILAAKSSNSTVRIITMGNCIGEWAKIEAMSTF